MPRSLVGLFVALATFLAIATSSGAAGAAVFYSNEQVSGVTTTGVFSLNTTLNSTSSLTHTATFDFGPTSARGTVVAATSGANNVTPFFQGNVASVPISGLTCGTTYHWAVVVAGFPDNDQTFTTSDCPAPAILVSPSTDTYGSVAVGSSGQQSFMIFNTGTADLVISSIGITGPGAASFALSLGTCTSLTPTVAPGDNCTVVVTFSPASAGDKSATAHVASNAGTAPSVTLTGKGFSVANVPTVSEWGMIFLVAAFAMILVLQSRNGGLRSVT